MPGKGSHTRNPIHDTALSPVAESLVDYEGYENTLYSLANAKSGPTIGNGFDFGQQSRKTMEAMGIPDSIIKKAETSGILGVRGKAARDLVRAMNNKGTDATIFSAGEVAFMSNAVTAKGLEFLVDDYGQADWDTRTTGEKTIALSLVHQYGKVGALATNGYKQLKNRQYPKLKANMNNWQDQTKDKVNGVMVVGRTAAAIDRRYASMSSMVPDVTTEPVQQALQAQAVPSTQTQPHQQAQVQSAHNPVHPN